MPYLKIQSNQAIESEKATRLIQQASKLVAEKLGKPERYVMAALDPQTPMVFAGNDAPLVFMELKSIGLNESQTPPLSEALCSLMHDMLSVDSDRVYIEFADAPRKMWGWNNSTF